MSVFPNYLAGYVGGSQNCVLLPGVSLIKSLLRTKYMCNVHGGSQMATYL